jgi:hypothetical protein
LCIRRLSNVHLDDRHFRSEFGGEAVEAIDTACAEDDGCAFGCQGTRRCGSDP